MENFKFYLDTRNKFYLKEWQPSYYEKWDRIEIRKQGIYFLLNNINEVVYIGCSYNLHKRIKAHASKSSNKNWEKVIYIEVQNTDIRQLEKEMIQKYKPIYNKKWLEINNK